MRRQNNIFRQLAILLIILLLARLYSIGTRFLLNPGAAERLKFLMGTIAAPLCLVLLRVFAGENLGEHARREVEERQVPEAEFIDLQPSAQFISATQRLLEDLGVNPSRLPSHWFCPITGQIFTDPVFFGNPPLSIERACISQLGLSHILHPQTRRLIAIEDVTPHLALRTEIEGFYVFLLARVFARLQAAQQLRYLLPRSPSQSTFWRRSEHRLILPILSHPSSLPRQFTFFGALLLSQEEKKQDAAEEKMSSTVPLFPLTITYQPQSLLAIQPQSLLAIEYHPNWK